MRPTILYCTLFMWYASTGGRFVALYLANEAQLSDTYIGIVLSVQMILISLLGGLCGSIADEMERKRPYHGRISMLRAGILFGTFVTIIEGIGTMYFTNGMASFWWNMGSRSFYAIALASTSPILDGLAIADLKRWCPEEDSTRRYGLERLHGAIWWGVGNVIIGLSCNRWGFNRALFVITITTASLCLCSLSLYEATTACLHTSENYPLLVTIDNKEGPCESTEEISHSGATSPANTDSQEAHSKTDESTWQLFRLAFKTPYRATFVTAFFFLNIGMSVIENMIFLFYQTTLGGTPTMCGLTVGFTVFFEIPIFQSSPYLLRTLGPGKMLSCACIAFILRTIGYVIVPRMGPVVLALDLFHGISYAMSQAAGVEFMARITPESYEASGQAFLLVVRGVAASVGVFAGGFLEENVGGRFSYGCLSGMVSFGLMVFVVTSITTKE